MWNLPEPKVTFPNVLFYQATIQHLKIFSQQETANPHIKETGTNQMSIHFSEDWLTDLACLWLDNFLLFVYWS